MARTQSKNELIVIEKVSLIDFYNTQVTPIDKKFTPMSEERNTSLCPFHIDTDPSLHYWKKNNIFHCFGCGYGGDVVKTYMQIRRQYYGERLSIERAVMQLASLFNIEIDEDQGYVVKSVFERAREALLEKETYTIPKDIMSVAEYRQLNNKVKSMNVPIKAKIANFEHLDAVASTLLGGK